MEADRSKDYEDVTIGLRLKGQLVGTAVAWQVSFGKDAWHAQVSDDVLGTTAAEWMILHGFPAAPYINVDAAISPKKRNALPLLKRRSVRPTLDTRMRTGT